MRALGPIALGYVLLLAGAACGRCPHASAAAAESGGEPGGAPAASTSGGEQASVAASTTPAAAASAAPVTQDELQGSWVEYWALSGRAETQRYTFTSDGRFGWCAGPDAGAPARRWGRFSVASDALVLNVQGEDATHGCAAGAGCRTLHEPAVEQRLPLGACPPNDEARALDAHYRCVSVAGQAFWLREPSTASDAEAAALAK